MLFNSSSPFNSSLEYLPDCSDPSDSVLITTVFGITRTFLLIPLSILILYLGHQRWRQQRSFSKMSHSDIFTFHVVAMELIWVLGCFFSICGSYVNLPEMMIVGLSISSTVFYGEGLFHLLTCVERYLAVVHPITYLGLRNGRGVRIRNISIGCVWLMCSGWVGVTARDFPSLPIIPLLSVIVPSLVVISFCSLSVLCVLIRPGPGKVGRNKEQPKQRVFFTITAIMGALWLWFAGFLVSILLDKSQLLGHSVGCLVMASSAWLNLPCSLVLPLLYLHRAGKLSCCCYNNK